MPDNDWQDHFFGFGMNFDGEGESTKKSSRRIGLLYTAECPECGTVFHYPNIPDWAYKVHEGTKDTLLCRYNCMRARQKKKEERIRETKERVVQSRREREAAKKKA